MRHRLGGSMFCLAGAMALVLRCAGVERDGPIVRELHLGRPISIAERPFRVGGFPASEACMNGDYTHLYTITSGRRAGEVWLCCVPVAELLRENFWCADGALVIGTFNGGSAADLKVQNCLLYDAQSEERRFTPVCVPAPLEAPL